VSTASPGLDSLLPAGKVLPAGERHRVPTADGGQLHVVTAGAGRPLVLVHGALLSLEAWALLWQPLLSADHLVIAYDLRGHGLSTLGRSGFGIHAYARDLAAVLDHFDVRQGVVVAHSTGGISALALAVGAPANIAARLAGQVLISTPPKGIGDSLQNRLLAPIVFSGLVHHRRTQGGAAVRLPGAARQGDPADAGPSWQQGPLGQA
jgi:non-heme chloroperoxidase